MAAVLRASALLVILCLVLLQNTDASNQGAAVPPSATPIPSPAPVPVPIDCGVACGVRCSKTKRPNLCKRACRSCCFACKCVPPGTYGNYEACPCYYNLKTRNLIRKCP